MTHRPLRIVFAGTPDFAAQHLQVLLADETITLVGVYTQPDRPAGRGKKARPGPVKSLALANDIPVYQPLDLNSSEQEAFLRSLDVDVMIVVAYGLLLPQAILATPRFGCLNVHASLLPRWRGAAPIERAILAGDLETGISIMQMDAGLDTGDILFTLKTPLTPEDNSQQLTLRLIGLGCQGLLEVLEQIRNNRVTPIQQTSLEEAGIPSTYAKKLSKAEALIDWNLSSEVIQRKVNAFFPRSPAFCFLNNKRIRIIQSHPVAKSVDKPPGTIIDVEPQGMLIACKDSSIVITHLQLEGKKANSLAAILNGQSELFSLGSVFKTIEEYNEN